MALAGEEIGHYLPDQRTAVAVAPGLQFGRRHPQRADDAVIERARGVVPYRFGGERKTQVVPAFAFAGAHRCLPLIAPHQVGQSSVPPAFPSCLLPSPPPHAFLELPFCRVSVYVPTHFTLFFYSP